MKRLARPWELPITVKVPLLVSAFMLMISLVISNTVLSRLAQTQERHLQTLSRAYVDGLSASLVPHILREDVWEVYDTLDRARSVYAGLNAQNTIVLNSAGRIIAASDPRAFPIGQTIEPALLGNAGADDGELVIDETQRTARMLATVDVQGQHIGSIYTELDISELLAERHAVLWQLIWTNMFLALVLASAGYIVVRRMVEPVRTLGAYLERGSDGPMEIIPEDRLRSAPGEFRRLFHRYNVMARAANERQELAAQLAKEEQLASLGRLASGMAHEINNPLGGLFNALDSLKRYGNRDDVRIASIRLIERGLSGIREVVRATLVTYRRPGDRGFFRREDIEDLRYLIKPALRQKQLTLEWSNEIEGELRLPRHIVRDAALNLLLNACAASPTAGHVHFRARVGETTVEIEICDKGSGMPEVYRAYLETVSPSSIPLKPGEGLGLWMVRRLLDEVGGSASIDAGPEGTKVRLSFPVAPVEVRDVA
jgi:signal transduction histidine kinase